MARFCTESHISYGNPFSPRQIRKFGHAKGKEKRKGFGVGGEVVLKMLTSRWKNGRGS